MQALARLKPGFENVQPDVARGMYGFPEIRKTQPRHKSDLLSDWQNSAQKFGFGLTSGPEYCTRCQQEINFVLLFCENGGGEAGCELRRSRHPRRHLQSHKSQGLFMLDFFLLLDVRQ